MCVHMPLAFQDLETLLAFDQPVYEYLAAWRSFFMLSGATADSGLSAGSQNTDINALLAAGE